MSYLNEMFRRIGLARAWAAAQFWATLLIVMAGVGWTRVPEKHAWQVGITLLLPLVIAAAFLILQAGTMRRLFNQQEGRTHIGISALTLLAWIALVWIAWAVLDWCDDQTFLWASYLNSRASAHARSRLFTYDHIQLWLTILIWIVRWIVIPAKVVPHALASAQWGWRLPCRKLLRVLLNWRWWLCVIVSALVGVLLPSYFFHEEPHGTVAHQVSAVTVKVAGAYLLAIICWVLLLAWAAVLLARQPEPAQEALDQQLVTRLWAGRRWIAGLVGWTILFNVLNPWMNRLDSKNQLSNWVSFPAVLVFLITLVILIAGMLRSMIGASEKRVRMIWGILMMLAWAALGLSAAILLDVYHAPDRLQILCWVLIAGLVVPFAASSAEWAVRLPWQKILRSLASWRWWAAVVAAMILSVALPVVLLPSSSGAMAGATNDALFLRIFTSVVLSLGSCVGVFAWFAVLLARTGRDPKAADEEVM